MNQTRKVLPPAAQTGARNDGAWEIFLVFLRLGLTCLGGSIAHLGYFRAEFVHRRPDLDRAQDCAAQRHLLH